MTKHFSSDIQLSNAILEGVNILADNVASTLGPRGRNVILQQEGYMPIVTKDGVTVARFIDLEDPIQNAGAQLVKQASSQTNLDAGDGTTTATVLTRAILNKAQKHITAGHAPIEIKRGIDKAVEVIVTQLAADATPIRSLEDIEHVAIISANGDEHVGKLVAKAIDCAGKDGAVNVQEARGFDTSLDLVEGFRMNAGYAASAFITDERRRAVTYENPLILVTDEKVDTVQELLPVLELGAREGRPLIVVASEIEGQALAALIMNSMRGTLKVAAIKAPAYGEERRAVLEDLALSTGATFVSRSNQKRLRDTKLTDLGSCAKIDITKYQTTIVDGSGDTTELDNRIEQLKEELRQEENLQICNTIQGRIARLASGIAIIRVGAATEVEMTEKKHRIEDALEAIRSAQAEGIVTGGGVALFRFSQTLEVETDNEAQATGVTIIKEALQEPLRQMAINAGLSPDLTVFRVSEAEGNNGVNFATGEMTDLFEAGVVDPAKVTRSALQNAASVAGALVTTNFAVVES